jgi:hypothetical protein
MRVALHEQKRSDVINDEARMTNDKGNPNAQMAIKRAGYSFLHSDLSLLRHYAFVISGTADDF